MDEMAKAKTDQTVKHPNLVFVLADQLRYQSCGYAGDEKARTPHIDRLAADSVNFCNAISGHPLCAPYRASLFTGKYTSSTGMVINELRMNPNHRCIGHVLGENGYETAYIGKWHLWGNSWAHSDLEQAYVPPGPGRLGFDGLWAAYNFNHEYYLGYYYRNSPERIQMEGFEPDGQTDLAIGVLERAAKSDQPCALFLSYGTPHDPWTTENVPEEYYDLFRDVSFERPPNYRPEDDPYADSWGRLGDQGREQLPEWMRVYYAMTANLDWNVGRLLAAVNRLGLDENTIFVFTSDHGTMFGAQGRGAKNTFYEEAVRVPFLIRRPIGPDIDDGASGPGRSPGHRVSDVCLNTVDLMPTFLSLLDLPIPEGVEGTDLSHCVLGRPGPEPEAAFLQGTGSTADWSDGHEWRALRTKRYTYGVYRLDGSECLFDHQEDPYQMHNLVGEAAHADTLQKFRALLAERLETLGDRFESCSWYRDHWTKDRHILRSATLKS